MDTIITSVQEKLPASIRDLLSETQPLPSDVTFIEQRFTLAELVERLALGLTLLAVGLLMLPFDFAAFTESHRNATVYSNNNLEWWLLCVTIVMCVAGWLLVASIPACLALGRRQKAGERTRYGIFLTPEALVWRSYFDTTVIPHANFRGLENRTVRYTASTGEKSFRLPANWVGTAAPEPAIRAWSQSLTPPALPPALPSPPPAP